MNHKAAALTLLLLTAPAAARVLPPRCALRAYACGNRALRDVRACGRYADAVLRRGGE